MIKTPLCVKVIILEKFYFIFKIKITHNMVISLLTARIIRLHLKNIKIKKLRNRL